MRAGCARLNCLPGCRACIVLRKRQTWQPCAHGTPQTRVFLRQSPFFAGVEQFQAQFVAYGAESDYEPAPTGWHRAQSLAGQQAQQAGGQPCSVPDNINLSIVCAPAEFGVPLKQDRQFMPFFKVQVRAALALPFKVYGSQFAVTQHGPLALCCELHASSPRHCAG